MGYIADYYDFNYVDSVHSVDYRQFLTLTDVNSSLYLLRAYGQWQHRINDQITTYAGLHLQKASINPEVALEPRLSAEWQFRPRHSLNAGFGLHSQLQPRVVYYAQQYDSISKTYSRTNEAVKFTRSVHYVLGYNYSIASDFRLRVRNNFV